MFEEIPFNFVCLSRDVSQRRVIERILRREGRIIWIVLRPLSFRNYKESSTVAERALNHSPKQPSSKFARTIKLFHLKLQYAGARRFFERHSSAVAVAWSALDGGRLAFMEGARAAGVQTLYLELAPVPDRISVDPIGVNEKNSLPRQLEPYFEWANDHLRDRKVWYKDKNDVQQRVSRCPRISSRNLPSLEDPYLFVPLQVPNDTQLRLFGGEFKTVDVFVSALVEAAKSLPDNWYLRLKEHPSSKTSVSKTVATNSSATRVWLDNDTDTFAQVASSRGVVTVNSSVGLQAFYFDKPVVVCGRAFWGIPEIATMALDLQSLKNRFSEVEALKFNQDARDAFMSYLYSVYFLSVNGKDFTGASIAVRLAGTDKYGFWRNNSTL